MAKLTQQEIEKEVERFKEHINKPVSEFTSEYINNSSVYQLINIGATPVSAALIAWLARAELAKGGKQ